MNKWMRISLSIAGLLMLPSIAVAQGTNLKPLVGYIDYPQHGMAVSNDPYAHFIEGWAFSCQTGRPYGERGIADASEQRTDVDSALVLVNGSPTPVFWYPGLARPDVVRHHADWCERPVPPSSGFRGYFLSPLPPGVHHIALQIADDTGPYHWQATVVVQP